MPKGNESTMALLIKAIEQDSVLQGYFVKDGSQGGIVQVHRDKVPAEITYPYVYLAEASESQDLRDSETVGGITPNYVEMLMVHCIVFGAGGELPKAILTRIREMLLDETNKAPVLAADTGNDYQDVFDVKALSMSRQDVLPTQQQDEMARDVYQSTQTFLLYGKKKGAV